MLRENDHVMHQVLIHNCEAVCSTEMLAETYDVSEAELEKIFLDNKQSFRKQQYYYSLTGREMKIFMDNACEFPLTPKNGVLILWTVEAAMFFAVELGSRRVMDIYYRLLQEYFAVHLNFEKISPGTIITVYKNSMVIEQREHNVIISRYTYDMLMRRAFGYSL